MTAGELLARLQSLDVHVRAEGGRLRVNAPKGRLTPDLEAALAARKEELLALLHPETDHSRAGAIQPLPRSQRLPLSYLQERLWVLQRLDPKSTAYNLATVAQPGGTIDVARLVEAVRRVVVRHEILRSRFVLEPDGPVVRIGTAEDVPVDIVDLRDRSEADRRQLLERAVGEAARRPFELALDAPVRFVVFRTAEEHAALLFSAHHIAVDSWSVGLVMREIASGYEALATGSHEAAPPPAVQYVDYAQWQRAAMEDASRALAFWRPRLASLPQFSTFPPDHPRALDGGSEGNVLETRLDPELFASVRALARDLGATVYMTFLAALAIVLSRRSGQTDVAIGSPLGTRERAELESMIGPIVNPLVLRLDLSDDPTFEQLVARSRDTVLEAHANQDIAFETLVKELNPERSLGHSPLFQVAMVMHNAPGAAASTIVGGGAIYDVTVFATEYGGSLGITFEYRTDLYAPSTIERISDHLQCVLERAVRERGRRASEIGGVSERERALVVDGFNDTRAEVDRSSVVAQFARTAAVRRDAVAVDAADGSLTYAVLDRLSAAIAGRLRALGAGPGSIVALSTERTRALPAAALGILRSGAAYVPIDPTYPAERLTFMLRDSGARHIVATRGVVRLLDAVAAGASVVVVDDLIAAAEAEDHERHGVDPSPDDLAYLIYTSGSTGTPKGVRVPHFAVSNFLGAMRQALELDADDVLLAVTSPSFDISVLELLLPLVTGGRVVVADRDTVSDGARLAALATQTGATVLQSTPSGWRLVVNAGWDGSPRLSAIAGGEPMPRALVDWLHQRVGAVWNGYGPTETTVYSSLARLDPGDPITIGRPVANTRIYVLDAWGMPAPVGAPGEICIAGDGVALGYHHRPELTAHRFVPDIGVPGATMYRTGDIGRWRVDGRLEHLGREDGQVKVRGYRIETGEIEAALTTHEAVKVAVVAVRAVSADDPRIVAWVQLEDDAECTGSELRRYLRQKLPEFMIPSIVIPVDAFALTPNGKIDRGALPNAFAGVTQERREVVAPSTPTERLIAEIWTRLLTLDRVSVTDTFFELGGHSLLAMRAAGEIAARIGRPIDPRLLFFRTLGQLAETADRLDAQPAGRA